MMVMNVTGALSAYAKSNGLMGEAGGTSAVKQSTGGQSFGSMVKDFIGDGINALHESEKAATQAVSGKADLASVVTAMENAEVMLTEITAIRDKVISAYKDITSGAI